MTLEGVSILSDEIMETTQAIYINNINQLIRAAFQIGRY